MIIKSEKRFGFVSNCVMGRFEEKLLFIGYYEAVREAGSKRLVYKPGLAQSAGARPSVGERA